MSTEVEAKVRVADPGALEARLAALGAWRIRSYHKDDRYFRMPPRADTGQAFDVRLRQDGGKTFLTFKDKVLRDGVERSAEHETSLGDPEVLALLLERLGGREYVRKTKVGNAWDFDGVLLELSEVQGLGWFLEVEIVVDDEEGKGGPGDAADTTAGPPAPAAVTAGADAADAGTPRIPAGAPGAVDEAHGRIVAVLDRLGFAPGDRVEETYTSLLLAARNS